MFGMYDFFGADRDMQLFLPGGLSPSEYGRRYLARPHHSTRPKKGTKAKAKRRAKARRRQHRK